MSKILGKNVALSIVINTSPQDIQLIGCGRTATLTTTVVTAPSSTAGSGFYQDFKALVNGWTVAVDGLATVDENMSIATLRGMQATLQPIIVSFSETTQAGSTYYSGYAFITSVSTSGNYNDAETYSVQLQGTGELLFDSLAVYGDYPTDIVSVLVAGPNLLITFTAVPYPVPSSYTLRIIDLDLNTTVIVSNFSSGDITPIDDNHHYAISIQSDYGALGKSLFSPYTYWPS